MSEWSVICIIFIIAVYSDTCHCISCIEIEESGYGAKFDDQDLLTLINLTPEEIARCFVLLGKEKLTKSQSSILWEVTSKIYGSGPEIPEEILRLFGWIANGIPPSQFGNLSLTDIDTVAAFGQCTELTPEQLNGLQYAIFDQWSYKELEDLTSYDLIALRQILCSFNASSLKLIHPESYREAATELSTLTNCPKYVIEELANLAVHPKAFGDPTIWGSLQVTSVGAVIAGLASITIIPPDAIEGLTRSQIVVMPGDVIQAMTSKQIQSLTPSAAGALTRQQKSFLSKSQKDVIAATLKLEDNSSLILKYNTVIVGLIMLFVFNCIIRL